jgi:hypothetical protein
MIDEVEMQLALRSKAMTLTVATTGTTSLAATASGYTRTTGSFMDDKFATGMEVTPAGFSSNTPRVITAVSALAITVSGTVPVQAAAGGRSLTVGLPSSRAWENVAFQPTAGVPWVREEFLPGPTGQATVGPFGRLDAFPMYALHIHVKDETGLTVKRYVNALRVLFAPRTKIPLPTSGTLAVRSDTGPYAGQLQQSQPGFVVQPFTIPLRLLDSSNII